MRSTLHQAIGRAKLRQDFLPVLDLRAYARLCGEIARASKVLSNKRTLVAFTYAPLEQLLVRSRAINLARLSAMRTLACCRCLRDGFLLVSSRGEAVRISGDGYYNRVWVSHPLVIQSAAWESGHRRYHCSAFGICSNAPSNSFLTSSRS